MAELRKVAELRRQTDKDADVLHALNSERLRSVAMLFPTLLLKLQEAEAARTAQAQQVEALLALVKKGEEERSKRTVVTMYLDSFRQEGLPGKALLSVGPIALVVAIFMGATGTSLIDLTQAISAIVAAWHGGPP